MAATDKRAEVAYSAMANKRYRIFILGAGFSRPAGYPLAPELWDEIRRRARSLTGRAAKFQDDLDTFLRYKAECAGAPISEDDVEFEEFCRFLDIEHFLGLRGSDTWSDDGNEGTIVIKTLLGRILAERTPSAEQIPNLYLDFAGRLQPGDYILTFNYDVLLERALDAVGKPYRLFPSRYESVRDGYAVIDGSKDEVVVLKLHGSIDWFDRSAFSLRIEQRAAAGLAGRPEHPVFGTAGDDLKSFKLVDGSRRSDDPLKEMFRVADVDKLYQRNLLFRAVPWLLAPSTMKILYASKLADFWYGLGRLGELNSGLTVIGYSLPQQDDYARQAVASIVTNYQTAYWGHDDIPGGMKAPFIVVDLSEDVEKFKRHYGFVDWDRAVLYSNGFDETSMSIIFDR